MSQSENLSEEFGTCCCCNGSCDIDDIICITCLSQEDLSEEYGNCCFCNGPCNPMSQACGSCARDVTGYSLGWRKEKPQLYDPMDLKQLYNSL